MTLLLSLLVSLPEHRGLFILGAGLIGLALVLRRLISALRRMSNAKTNHDTDADRIRAVVRPPERIDSVSSI